MREAWDLYPNHFPDVAAYGGCVGMTACVIVAAQRRGIKLVPQAGDCQWLMVTPEHDDGVSPTHIAYKFEGLRHPAVVQCILDGVLPELHVWATDPQSRYVVDGTTRFLPDQAIHLLGPVEGRWRAPEPPEWLWRKRSKCMRFDCLYRADTDATAFVVSNFINLAIDAVINGRPFRPRDFLYIPQPVSTP